MYVKEKFSVDPWFGENDDHSNSNSTGELHIALLLKMFADPADQQH
jgi:hypothetical protein